MSIQFKIADESDIPFLREMLYEAVYWRSIAENSAPPPEEGLAVPEVGKALDDWGRKDGDSAIICLVDSVPAGAAWYRYWTDENNIRGHISGDIPTLVIAVHKDYRRKGIARQLLEKLIEHGAENSVKRISLMVSKDNFAAELYRQCRFTEYADEEHSWLMLYDF